MIDPAKLPMRALFEDLWAEIASKVTELGNGCAKWDGTHFNGHPVINVRNNNYRVIPWILEAKLGHAIPDGMNTLHTCGFKQCVNPEHLYPAAERGIVATPPRSTYAVSAGGYNVSPEARSWHNRPTKLTVDAVRDIRSSPLSAAELAKKYFVDKMTVHYARIGKTWKHVT